MVKRNLTSEKLLSSTKLQQKPKVKIQNLKIIFHFLNNYIIEYNQFICLSFQILNSF